MNQPLHNPLAGPPQLPVPPPPLDVPPPPRTPSAHARRLIFGYQGTQKVMLILGVVFTLVGIPAVLFFAGSMLGDAMIDLGGNKAQGQVTEWRTVTNVTINGQHPVEISYTFDVNGEPRSGSSSTTNDDLIDGLEAGRAIDIEYAGSYSRAAGTTYSMIGYAGLAGFLFPLIGGLMLFFTIRANRREIAAFTHGTLAHATITESGYDYSAKLNGRHPYKITWQFTVDTDVYKGSLTSMEFNDLAGFVVGREVAVLYLPEKPAVNTLYLE